MQQRRCDDGMEGALAVRIDVYTHQDDYVATIGADALLALSHTDELNGEDSLAITTTFPLKQGYRLVWADHLGKVHEHVCQDPQGLHAGGATVYTDTALNSICELYGDYIEDKRPYSYGFLKALNVALEPTRWTTGTVDQPGAVASGLTFYHTSAREALQAILECGGELETEIEVSGSEVSARKMGIRQHRGESSTHRRFTYTKDLTSIGRTEHFSAITACYGYGKGVETDSGGYGRKLTFGDINDGKNYVEDAAALKSYGRPDGNGGFAHVFGKYENSDCEDASQLLSETKAYLAEHNEPGVTYEANVIDLVQFGRDWEGVGVGDDVQIVDTEYSPELRCSGRVTKLVTDLLGGAMTVTLGNVTETMADMWGRQQQAVSSLSKRSSNWDVAANTPAAYLQQVIDGLNEQFNTQGMSYCFTSFEQGTIWSSVPLDENGNPTQTGGSAIQICSQGFRIASGTKADGSYDWRTFGTGEGFTADEITAGTLNADLIKAGRLSVKKDGKDVFYADVDDGSVYIGGASVSIGGDTVDEAIKASGTKYAYCYTSSDTAAKAVSVSDFELTTGKSVTVRFSYANTAASPTLNVSDTGAKPIAYAGYSYLPSKYYWKSGDVLTFIYDGSYWQLADGGSKKNARSNWASDTTSVTVEAGTITMNSGSRIAFGTGGTFTLNSTNMTVSSSGTVTANYFTANGAFTGGTTTGTGYGMKLGTDGCLRGYRNGTEIGRLDPTSSVYYIPTGETLYGMQLYGAQVLREVTPHKTVLASSNTSGTSTRTGTGTVWLAGFTYNPGERWDVYSLTAMAMPFINGHCTRSF